METRIEKRQINKTFLLGCLGCASWSTKQLSVEAGILNVTIEKWLDDNDSTCPQNKTLYKIIAAFTRRFEILNIDCKILLDDFVTHPTHTRISKMREMRNNGISNSDIGKHFGISRERVRQVLGKYEAQETECIYCGDIFTPKRPCSIFCKPICRMGYKRTGKPKETLIGKFTTLVAPPNEAGCWEWQGYLHQVTGYGIISVNGKNQYAHRISWTLTHGAIPDGLFVLHKCSR